MLRRLLAVRGSDVEERADSVEWVVMWRRVLIHSLVVSGDVGESHDWSSTSTSNHATPHKGPYEQTPRTPPCFIDALI